MPTLPMCRDRPKILAITLTMKTMLMRMKLALMIRSVKTWSTRSFWNVSIRQPRPISIWMEMEVSNTRFISEEKMVASMNQRWVKLTSQFLTCIEKMKLKLLRLKFVTTTGLESRSIRNAFVRSWSMKQRKISLRKWSWSKQPSTRKIKSALIVCMNGKRASLCLKPFRNSTCWEKRKLNAFTRRSSKRKATKLSRTGWSRVWSSSTERNTRRRSKTTKNAQLKKSRKRPRNQWKLWHVSLIKSGKSVKLKKIAIRKRWTRWRNVAREWRNKKLKWHVDRWSWRCNVDRVAVVKSCSPMALTRTSSN